MPTAAIKCDNLQVCTSDVLEVWWIFNAYFIENFLPSAKK